MASRGVINIMHGHPAFWCPVCGHPHWLDGRWKWNGSFDKPTFGPTAPGARFSFLSFSGGHVRKLWRLERPGKVGQQEFATQEDAQAEIARAGLGPEWKVVAATKEVPRRVYCHSYVRDGKIQILSDTPHALAGQTVALESWTLEDDGSYHKDEFPDA